MKFEEVLPAIKLHKLVTRSKLDGNIQLIKCKDNKTRLRIWRGNFLNCPYKIEATDILADDWKII